MNTRGAWQEKLSWLIATTYGRSVPVFIYKYGRITTGVLLGFRRRKVMRDLAQRITELSGEREHSTLGGRPDVIAHSFGTWLIGHALASTEDDLKGLSVGRVVLLGSILRPNFAWAGACHRGRAEAVLNHYGARDRWAGIGGYVIYDAGPSGRRGFDPLDADGSPQVAIGRQELEFGHRTFFDPVYMEKAYVECWKPFLTAPMSQLPELERGAPHAAWRPPPRVLRFGVATLVLLLTVACGMVLGISVVVGLRQLLS
jgi:pimeloyl-ACP methyl ester carboxylesterase